MKVKELIEELQKYNQEAEVSIPDDSDEIAIYDEANNEYNIIRLYDL